MLRSRALVARAGRSFRPKSSPFLGFRCLLIPDDENNGNSDAYWMCHHQAAPRRHLNTGGGGRRHGWKNSNEDSKRNKNKPNFAKEYLEPAARGELKAKHSSGIPKLAVRRSKGHNIKGDDDASERKSLDELDEFYKEAESDDTDVDTDVEDGNLVATMSRDISRAKRESRNRKPPGGGGGEGGKSMVPSGIPPSKPNEVVSVGYDTGRTDDYWKEEDYDDCLFTDEDKALASQILGSDGAINDEDIDPMTLAGMEEIAQIDLDEILNAELSDGEDEESSADDAGLGDGDDEAEETPRRGRRGRVDDDDDDETIPKKQMNVITPMNTNEPDFWRAIRNHPTQYAEVRYHAIHPESKREPRPFYPKNRNNPPSGILDFFKRWLYITGLPPALPEGGLKHGGEKTLTTLQQQEIQKAVTRLLGVSFGQVFPANATSAFVGFESAENRDLIVRKGPSESMLTRTITMAPYTPSENDMKRAFFQESTPGTTVILENIPPDQLCKETLGRNLFPEGSDLGAANTASSFKVNFPTPTTALIQFDSEDRAKSVVSSDQVAARLEKLGKYPVRMFKARRNLVHQGMDGTAWNREIRTPGAKLIVDGDMPSKYFYQSHAGAIMLRNLDRSSVTKESLTEFFQPYSGTFRDEKGSIEFIDCLGGLPTDRAYVGFDRLGEAEAVMQAFGGYARIGNTRVVMKLVKDRGLPGLPKRVSRPERTEEELMKSLNDWEQYVDQEDIKYLEKHGVAKVFIDEALRGLRFQNRSFGALDWAMRDEKLEPEKESGDDYKEMVQMYIETLKECIATPENPGDIFEGMHFPDEPIDMTIFDREKKRTREMLKKRGL